MLLTRGPGADSCCASLFLRHGKNKRKSRTPHVLSRFGQRATLMNISVIGLITLDVVVPVALTAMASTAFELQIFRMLSGDHAPNVPDFGAPPDLVSD